MLIERYGNLSTANLFVTSDNFNPFPKYQDREAWNSTSDDSKTFWLSQAEKYFDYNWPSVKMELFMNLIRTGNITDFYDIHMERRSVLGVMVLVECLEGKGRFLDQIINGIYAICEETSWMQPISNTKMKEQNQCLPDASDHVVELAGSETAALLTWTYYLFKDKFDGISSRINQKIREEVSARMLKPYIRDDDYWWHGYKGNRVNNWNPWCNGNVLMGFLVLEEDEAVKEAGIKKIMESLDVFINTHSPDGCCDEGPMYWGRSGGSLYDCAELFYLATSGKINIFDEQIIQDIGRYLYRVHIHEEYCVDFADGDARVRIPADVAFGYGKQIGDENLIKLGASSPSYWGGIFNWFPLYRYIRDIFQEEERKKHVSTAPYVLNSWMDHAEVMTVRENEGNEQGLYLAAKGGHNLESHNHNDIGNFIVYADGLPVIIDMGTEDYTAKTFSPQRFELWYLQSAYHNLPTVNGVMQHDGKEYRADHVQYQNMDNLTELSMNIQDAYPKDSGIIDWKRSIRMVRALETSIEIEDDFHLYSPTKDISFTLMTTSESQNIKDGLFALEYAPNKRVLAEYDPEQLTVSCERIDITDRRLKSNWGDTVYRVLLSLNQPLGEGKVKLILRKE